MSVRSCNFPRLSDTKKSILNNWQTLNESFAEITQKLFKHFSVVLCVSLLSERFNSGAADGRFVPQMAQPWRPGMPAPPFFAPQYPQQHPQQHFQQPPPHYMPPHGWPPQPHFQPPFPPNATIHRFAPPHNMPPGGPYSHPQQQPQHDIHNRTQQAPKQMIQPQQQPPQPQPMPQQQRPIVNTQPFTLWVGHLPPGCPATAVSAAVEAASSVRQSSPDNSRNTTVNYTWKRARDPLTGALRPFGFAHFADRGEATRAGAVLTRAGLLVRESESQKSDDVIAVADDDVIIQETGDRIANALRLAANGGDWQRAMNGRQHSKETPEESSAQSSRLPINSSAGTDLLADEISAFRRAERDRRTRSRSRSPSQETLPTSTTRRRSRSPDRSLSRSLSRSRSRNRSPSLSRSSGAAGGAQVVSDALAMPQDRRKSRSASPRSLAGERALRRLGDVLADLEDEMLDELQFEDDFESELRKWQAHERSRALVRVDFECLQAVHSGDTRAYELASARKRALLDAAGEPLSVPTLQEVIEERTTLDQNFEGLDSEWYRSRARERERERRSDARADRKSLERRERDLRRTSEAEQRAAELEEARAELRGILSSVTFPSAGAMCSSLTSRGTILIAFPCAKKYAHSCKQSSRNWLAKKTKIWSRT